MKKSIKAIAATMLIGGVLSVNSYAQEETVSTSIKTTYTSNPVSASKNDDNSRSAAITSSVSKKDIDARVISKFSRLFPAASNEKWVVTDDGYWVSFLNEGRNSTAGFTKKGKLNYSTAECVMEQLPEALRMSLCKEYASYKMFNAVEIKAYEAVAYQVVLENADGYITLKYTSEGVEEIQRLKKSAN